jgi:hypothetical protein
VRAMKIVWKKAEGDPLVSWEIGSPKAHVHAYEVELADLPGLQQAVGDLARTMAMTAEELMALPFSNVKGGGEVC